MKKQLIASFISVFAVTTIAQPSFAMKRNRPVHPGDLSAIIPTLVLAVKWFLARQPDVLDYDDPFYFRPNCITLVSQSGTHFNILPDDLGAVLHLTPTIANILLDFEGNDGAMIPLNLVSDPALYLLTEMGSGANPEALLNYIRSLRANEIEKLKNDAQFLDSRALKDLISRALRERVAKCGGQL